MWCNRKHFLNDLFLKPIYIYILYIWPLLTGFPFVFSSSSPSAIGDCWKETSSLKREITHINPPSHWNSNSIQDLTCACTCMLIELDEHNFIKEIIKVLLQPCLFLPPFLLKIFPLAFFGNDHKRESPAWVLITPALNPWIFFHCFLFFEHFSSQFKT